ncbi:unnamed protein product [Albugo candida]|uniref:Uncharacterized protein n=1 Tax=Albugo candida TaxID=65357 RepID=A0A024G8F6_9STRA|nr:unnamed protein product [Albugo candida]|eukprot:CCI43033.1 unnamed protein product [Albugo candida]
MNEILTLRLQQQATEAADQKDCIEKLSLQLRTILSELEDRTIILTKVQTEYQYAVRLLEEYQQQLKQVSASSTIVTKHPDTNIDSPNLCKKLCKALRLENDEVHRKADGLRATVEHLQRQIHQPMVSKKQTINVGSRKS